MPVGAPAPTGPTREQFDAASRKVMETAAPGLSQEQFFDAVDAEIRNTAAAAPVAQPSAAGFAGNAIDDTINTLGSLPPALGKILSDPVDAVTAIPAGIVHRAGDIASDMHPVDAFHSLMSGKPMQAMGQLLPVGEAYQRPASMAADAFAAGSAIKGAKALTALPGKFSRMGEADRLAESVKPTVTGGSRAIPTDTGIPPRIGSMRAGPYTIDDAKAAAVPPTQPNGGWSIRPTTVEPPTRSAAPPAPKPPTPSAAAGDGYTRPPGPWDANVAAPKAAAGEDALHDALLQKLGGKGPATPRIDPKVAPAVESGGMAKPIEPPQVPINPGEDFGLIEDDPAMGSHAEYAKEMAKPPTGHGHAMNEEPVPLADMYDQLADDLEKGPSGEMYVDDWAKRVPVSTEDLSKQTFHRGAPDADTPLAGHYFSDDPEVAQSYAELHGKDAKITTTTGEGLKKTAVLDFNTEEAHRLLDDARESIGLPSWETHGDINLGVEEALPAFQKAGFDSIHIKNMPSPDDALASESELVRLKPLNSGGGLEDQVAKGLTEEQATRVGAMRGMLDGRAGWGDKPATGAPPKPLADQSAADIVKANPPVQGEGGDYARFGKEELRQFDDGEPGIAVDTDDLRGETRIVYRGSDGKPMASARVVGDKVFSVAAEGKGLAKGRALKAVIAEVEKLKPTGIVGGLSPDAQRMVEKLMSKGKPSARNSMDTAAEEAGIDIHTPNTDEVKGKFGGGSDPDTSDAGGTGQRLGWNSKSGWGPQSEDWHASPGDRPASPKDRRTAEPLHRETDAMGRRFQHLIDDESGSVPGNLLWTLTQALIRDSVRGQAAKAAGPLRRAAAVGNRVGRGAAATANIGRYGDKE